MIRLQSLDSSRTFTADFNDANFCMSEQLNVIVITVVVRDKKQVEYRAFSFLRRQNKYLSTL